MNLLFIGPPGSGKGTQSKRLREKFGLAHLSTGDMFREAIANQTEVGLKAKAFMDRGEYVPDSVVIDLIRVRLKEKDCANGFILDGFPRTEPQAVALEHLLSDMHKNLDHTLFFDVKTEMLVQRLSSRRTCRNCNRVISFEQIQTDAGKELCKKNVGTPCDFYQRSDDDADVVKKRIEVYQKQTAPIIDFYKNKTGFLKLDAALPEEQVFEAIDLALREK